MNCKWWKYIILVLCSESSDTLVDSQQSNQRTNTINSRTKNIKKQQQTSTCWNMQIGALPCAWMWLSCHKAGVHVCHKIINERKMLFTFPFVLAFFHCILWFIVIEIVNISVHYAARRKSQKITGISFHKTARLKCKSCQVFITKLFGNIRTFIRRRAHSVRFFDKA